LGAVNDRILSDTRGNLFLTLFFGVLETHTGRLRYSNGGHPPGLLVKTQRNKALERLTSSGMALGVMEKYHWQQKLTQLAEGDVLLLYTDGFTEAQNQQGKFFGEERLANLLRSLSSRSAIEIQRCVG
jgi:serine phosphatase RsbU (regulator of sigma subunit)